MLKFIQEIATLTKASKIRNVLPGSDPTDVVTVGQLSEYVDINSPYKRYVAIMNQSNTDAPTATVLENTIGNIVWSYLGVGEYYASLTGAFTAGKTVVFISSSSNASVTPSWVFRQVVSENQIYILTMDNTDSNANNIFKGDIEIRVYN